MAATIETWIATDRIETGLWCTTCRLPSAVRVPLLTVTSEGVGPASIYTWCPECTPTTPQEDT